MNEEKNETKGAHDQRVGAFVTNKWLVGVLVILVMSMGGYIFRGYDKSNDAQASQIAALDHRLSAVEIDSAATKSRIEVQYADLIRRLDRIEGAVLYRNRVSGP
jgi:hypothetical protein